VAARASDRPVSFDPLQLGVALLEAALQPLPDGRGMGDWGMLTTSTGKSDVRHCLRYLVVYLHIWQSMRTAKRDRSM
jgi:hypothetical protein